MEKYDLLAKAVNTRDVDEAVTVLDDCKQWRCDDTYSTLYCVVAMYIADRLLKAGNLRKVR